MSRSIQGTGSTAGVCVRDGRNCWYAEGEGAMAAGRGGQKGEILGEEKDGGFMRPGGGSMRPAPCPCCPSRRRARWG
eukprot:106081-Chlamydomonas_euryale.AAC.2